MIKPSTAAPTALTAPRPVNTPDADPRPVERDGETTAFSEVMDEQGPRAAGESTDDDSAPAGEARDSAGPSSPATETTATATTPIAMEHAATGSVDDLLALCTFRPAEPRFIAGALPGSVTASGLPGDGPCRSLVASASIEAGDPGARRSLLDAELQTPLGLGGSTALAQFPDVATPLEGSPRLGAVEPFTQISTGVGPANGMADARPAGRPVSLPAPPPSPLSPELRSPLGSGAWTDELGAQLTWMVDRGDHVASLRLSPENLGPLEVRIAVREGETSVWFGAASAETRAALEQSLPRLKELLAGSGLSLADAGVFSHTPRDPQRGFTAAALARASRESGVEPADGIVMQVSRRGLVDLYA